MDKAPADYIALLGKRDFPTDGVVDYCEWLQAALLPHDTQLQFYHCPWQEQGWWSALGQLWQASRAWRGKWVIIQYVAFSWSYTGVPLALLTILLMLRLRQTRVAVIFHDTQGFPGTRWVYRLRRRLQHGMMRLLSVASDRTILTLAPEITPWLPQPVNPKPINPKIVQIPVGSNVPEPPNPQTIQRSRSPHAPIVAIFGITCDANGLREIDDIAYAVKAALPQVPDLHLLIMGRGSEDFEAEIRAAFAEVPVTLSVLGLLPQPEVSQHLCQADVLLFVRGNISSGRTSAVVGVACGVPIVAYRGTHTGFPITEAGVILLPFGDKPGLAEALTQVLTDETLWQDLHQRNLTAWQDYFAWATIANRYLEALPHD